MPAIIWWIQGTQWYLQQIRTLFAMKSDRPPSKPPDPNQMQRRLLLRLALLTTLPIFVRSHQAQMTAYVARGTTQNISDPLNVIRMHVDESTDHALLMEIDAKRAVCDSGCTGLATPHHTDFIDGTYRLNTSPQHIKGIAGGLSIKGTGTIRYEAVDSNGKIRVLQGRGWHIPDLPCRLISPQQVCP
jgi:hypothetical protein